MHRYLHPVILTMALLSFMMAVIGGAMLMLGFGETVLVWMGSYEPVVQIDWLTLIPGFIWGVGCSVGLVGMVLNLVAAWRYNMKTTTDFALLANLEIQDVLMLEVWLTDQTYCLKHTSSLYGTKSR